MRLTIAASIAVALGAMGASAEAYPQFQFTMETARCNMCHFAPAGGGLINGWGRDEAGETVSRGGDGSFLHGAWDSPSWLSIGGDYRGAFGVKETNADEPDYLAFPMQADLYTMFKAGDFSLALTVGARGSARPRDPPPMNRVASREHYVMWRPKTRGAYVRAGRFYAPFGLRQPDHTAYIRRDLGFYAWEETSGLSVGYVEGDSWELHATGFVRDPLLRVGPPGKGGAIMFEKRVFDETAAWGVQSKLHLGDDRTRAIAGATGKLYLEKLDLLLLSEVDGVWETFDADGVDARGQVVGHLNVTYFPTRGVMAGTTLEYLHEDLSLSGKHRESATLTLQYFPRAHWEFTLLGRYERVGGGSEDVLGLFMLHYYL